MNGMVITWIPCGDNPKKIRHNTTGPLDIEGVDPTADIRWKIHVFNGLIECTPRNDLGKCLWGSTTASFRFYTPRNQVNPRPDAPKTDVDRRPVLVAIVDGHDARLERGHAVVVATGAGVLIASWDYPEYDHHPKI